MTNTISVLVAPNDADKSIFGSGTIEVPVERLKSNLAALVTKLMEMTSAVAVNTNGIRIKEFEVGIEVTAEGGVSLIGSAKAAGTASFKLTFTYDK